MAQTLTNFLVGIGLDTTDFKKGEKDVNSGLGVIKSGAILASAALVGIGLAIGGAINAGNRIDDIALASAKLNTSAKFVNNYGNALRLLGGDANESISAIDAVESALAQFRLKGSFSAFEDPTLAGIDTNALSQAKNGEEFLRMLAAQIPNLNKDQQRLIQENFGFSDATMASLRRGQAEFDALVLKAEELAPGFEKAVDAAREYNVLLAETQLKFEGIGNSLAISVLPALTGVLGGISKFIEDVRKSPTDTAVSFLEKQFPITASLLSGKGFGGAKKAAAGAGSAGDWFGISDSLSLPKAADSVKNRMRTDRSKYELTGQYDNPINAGLERAVKPINDAVGEWRDKDRSAMYGSEVAERARNNGKLPPIQNNINMTVQLDGQALDTKITEVQSRRDRDTIDDIKSTTSR